MNWIHPLASGMILYRIYKVRLIFLKFSLEGRNSCCLLILIINRVDLTKSVLFLELDEYAANYI